MITRAAADSYFEVHLRGDEWTAIPEATRNAAVAMADSDVSGELGEMVLSDEEPLHVAAVSEQAIELVAVKDDNNHVPANMNITSESIDGVGSRTYEVKSGNSTIALRAQNYIDRIRRGNGVFRFNRG